jgi:hypothetical protein
MKIDLLFAVKGAVKFGLRQLFPIQEVGSIPALGNVQDVREEKLDKKREKSMEKDDIILTLETIEEELEFLIKNLEENKPGLSDLEFGLYLGLCVAYWKTLREINERWDKIEKIK